MKNSGKNRPNKLYLYALAITSLVLVASFISSILLLPTGVSASIGQFLGISLDKGVSYQISMDSDVPKFEEFNGYVLENGIWYDEYTRVFSIGGDKRIVEVSNYPRTYKDTIAHVYEKDATFTVTEDDLNSVDESGVRCYFDMTLQKPFYLKDKAVHHAGEPLPGAFPRWVEYETIQPIIKEGKVSLTKVPSPFSITSQVKSLDDTTTVKTESSTISKEKELTVSAGAIIVYFEAKR